MKKILSLVISFILCFSAITGLNLSKDYSVFASELDDNNSGISFDFDSFLEIMDQDYYNRSSLNKSTQDSPKPDPALFLAEKFLEGGLKPSLYTNIENPTAENFIVKSTTNDLDGESFDVRNVIGYKPARQNATTAQNVIIAAHYDNIYGFEVINPYNSTTDYLFSHGINDNASGLAVLLAVLGELIDVELDFNIIFISFDAEEVGLLGSKAYVDNMSEIDKENLLLMINIDSIIAGDNLYMFARDWNTEHEKFFRQEIKDAQFKGIPLATFPADKKYSADYLGGVYTHIGYQSDNYYFLKQNLNTVAFLAYNLSVTNKAGAGESNNHADLTHTGKDNLAKIKEIYPDYLLKMQTVTHLISNKLSQDGFANAMNLSREKSPNYSLFMNPQFLNIIVLVLCLVAVILAVIYYNKLKVKANKKMEEFLKDPEQMQKVNVIFKDFQNMGNMKSSGNFTYHPRTYKPKDGENDFSVFGEGFEEKDKGYGAEKDIDKDTDKNIDKDTEKNAEKDTDKNAEKGTNKKTEKGADKKTNNKKDDDGDDVFRF